MKNTSQIGYISAPRDRDENAPPRTCWGGKKGAVSALLVNSFWCFSEGFYLLGGKVFCGIC